MAATAETIRAAPPALLDPGMTATRTRGSRARAATTSDPSPRGDQSYHDVGRALLDLAMRKGRREAASAAVEVFRTALGGAPNEPSLRNGIGAALVEYARLEANAAAVDLLSEAAEHFQAALATVTKQKAPRAVSVRYQTNLALVSWMLGERLGDAARISAAVETLRSVLTERSEVPARISVDRARAQDILGCALMSLGRPAEAISAYQAAIDHWDNPIGRARSLNNLGTAYVEEGHYREARRTYADALALQSPDDQPMARNLTQYNLGCVLLREALSIHPSHPKIEEQLDEAVQLIAPARYAYRFMRSSQDWVVMTMGLANARLSYGTYLRLPGPAADRQKGTDNIDQAIALYKEVIPQLTATQLRVGLGNMQIALQILARLSGDGETLTRLREHVIETIALRVGHQDKSSSDEGNSVGHLSIIKLIDNLDQSDTISVDMAKSADLLVSDILDLLVSSELPKAEWPGILRSALGRAGYPEPRLADQVEQAAAAAGRTTTRRAPAKPRTKDDPRLRAARLQATYETLVRETNLENPSLSAEERRRQAKHIDKTYYRLRELVPSYRDDSKQLRLAHSELNKARYQRRKARKRAAHQARLAPN